MPECNAEDIDRDPLQSEGKSIDQHLQDLRDLQMVQCKIRPVQTRSDKESG